MHRSPHVQRFSGRAAAVLTVLVLVAVATACDPFYQPPSPVPGARNGDVIRSRASVFTLDPVAKTPFPGVRANQILYRSEDALGNTIAVSGTVLVPTASWTSSGKRPLVTFAVGTRGLGDACAPSKTLANGTDYEGASIASLLGRGWAVVVTDYQGLGTPGTHTYVVGQTEGRSVLDAARAAQRLPGSGLGAVTPVAVLGYSQGGGAAAWAAELAPTYAPELDIRGVAEGGVPADLNAVAAALDGSPAVALALLAAVGFDAAYPELDLAQYLNDRGRALAARSGSVCIASYDGVSTIADTGFTHISDYTTSNPLATPVWQARLGQNRLGGRRPTVPVFQWHAMMDTIVAFPQAQTLRDTYCASGVNVTWLPIPATEHVSGLVAGLPFATNFLADRFAGSPTAGNCP